MLAEYLVAGIIVLMLAVSSYILISAMLGDIEKTRIEIVIDADTADEDFEYAVITAKRVADKYFRNCDVYIRGGENELVDALCRTHGVTRKDF